MVCPDLSEIGDFTLSGNTESMITHNFILNFDRCNSSARNDCRSDAEIDAYIKNIRIDISA
jgi:hypothetical protein